MMAIRTADQESATRELRRLRAEDCTLTRLGKREKEVAPLIGELCREGKTVYYINLRRASGAMTGKTKESASFHELSDYLIRNNY